MSDYFIRLHLFLSRYRLSVCVVAIAACTAAGLLAASLQMDEDIMRMLPQSDPVVRSHFHAFKKLRQTDRLIVDIGISEANDAILFEAADRMFAALQRNPELQELTYRFELRDFPGSLRLLHNHLPSLLGSPEAYETLAQSILPEAMVARLAWLRQALAQPQGFVVTDVARVDPLGLGTSVMKRLQSVHGGVGDTRIVDGRIVNHDGCHVLITAMPRFSSANIERSGVMIEALLADARAVERAFPAHKIHVAIGGGHRIGLDNSRLVRRDPGRAVSIAAIAMVLLSFLAYRRRWLALITLVPTLVGASIAGATLFFIGQTISGIAVGCGTILLGITVDYAIHVLYHIDNAAHMERRSIATTVLHIAPPIGFGALTTVGAFLVMLLSPVETHRQVGLFAVVGVTSAALASLFLLPVLVPLSRHHEARPLIMTRVFERFFAWRARHLALPVVAIVLLSIPCAIGITRLRFEGDIAKLNGVTPSMALDQDILWDAWGDAASMTTVVVAAPAMQDALEMNDRVAASLTALQDKGAIVSYSSIAPMCPSARTQNRNVTQWKRFWTPAKKQALLSDIQRIAPEAGFRADSIARTLEVIDAQPDILTPEALRPTMLGQMMAQQIHSAQDDTAITTLVKLPSPAHYAAVANRIKDAVPGAVLLNRVAFSQHIARLSKRGLARFALMVTIADALILLLLLRHPKWVLIVLLPIGVGLLWTFGMMGLLGLPINIINFVFVIFVIGVGIDYSLFLVTATPELRRGRPERLATTSGSITVCALTTICGFGVLAIARHPALHSIGVTAFMGMTFSLVSTILIVPYLTGNSPSVTSRKNTSR